MTQAVEENSFVDPLTINDAAYRDSSSLMFEQLASYLNMSLHLLALPLIFAGY